MARLSKKTKPFVLDQAVETAMNYMAPLANKLPRLRTLIRVPVADASRRYKRHFGWKVSELILRARETKRTLSKDLFEVRLTLPNCGRCVSFLTNATGQQRARPQLILKLSADTCMLLPAAQDQVARSLVTANTYTPQLIVSISAANAIQKQNLSARIKASVSPRRPK